MTVVRGVAVGACVLALCACGKSTPKPAVVLASKSATGNHASATASFTFAVLRNLSVRVKATPAQGVKGGWVVSCKGGIQLSRKSADFAGRTPLEVVVHYQPIPHPRCEFVAEATLARSGRVRVELRGRRP